MPQIILRARAYLSAALITCSCLHASAACAQDADDAMTRANRLAYDAAIKCAVADVVAADDRHHAGDESKAAAYHAKSRQSFDTAYAMGEKLGLSEKQTARDLDFAQVSELPRMIRDQNYFLETAATCKALGLM